MQDITDEERAKLKRLCERLGTAPLDTTKKILGGIKITTENGSGHWAIRPLLLGEFEHMVDAVAPEVTTIEPDWPFRSWPPRRPTLEHLAQIGYEASMKQQDRTDFVPWSNRSKALNDHWMAVAIAIASWT